MTVGEDLLLLATDPKSGKCRLGSSVADLTVGGANLVDLIRADRVELTGEKRTARVVLTDKTPVGNPVLDRAIMILQTKGPMRPQAAVRQLGKKSMQPLYEALQERGEVRLQKHKALGLFTVSRWPVDDAVRRDNLIQLVQSSLLYGLDASTQTGPLIGLLAASDKLGLVVDRPEVKAAKARAKVIAEGDWASAEVRKAIQAANSAVLAALVSASTAATAGS